MNRIYLSSGCIYNRKTGCDLRLLAECTQRLPISGIELMVIRQWYDDIEGLVARVSELRICVSLLHIEKTVGEHLSQERNAEAMQALEKNLIVAGKLAVRKAVLHLWHGQGSDRNLTNNIEGLGPMRELAAEYGTELLVENIPCENTDEVQLLLRIAARYREQKFVFDTKNAAFCDHMAPAVLEQVFDAIPVDHIHLSDYSGDPRRWENARGYSFPGDGRIDFPGFFAMLKDRSYAGDFTVETPITDQDGGIDFAQVRRKMERIRQMADSRGDAPLA